MPSLVAAGLVGIFAGRGIGDLALSFDEFFSLNAIVRDPRNSIGSEGPIFPYYAVLWVWSGGGEWTNDVWLRAPSLLSAMGAAALTAQIARRFAGLKAAYASGLLFALNPGVHFVAQEARPYSLGLLLFTAAAFALLRALDQRRLWYWASFSIVLLMATAVMPNGLVIFVPLVALYSAIWSRFFFSRHFVLSVVPAALLVVLQLIVFASQISTMRASLPRPSVTWLPTGVIWAGISEAESYGAPGTFAAVLLVLAALSVLGRRILWSSLAVVALVFLFSLGPSSHYMGRTFVTLLPLVSVAAAFSVVRLDRRAMTATVAVAVLFAMPGYTAVRLWDSAADLKLATQIVEREAEATDQIFGDGYLGAGRPYELAAGISHYSSTIPPWEVTTEPTREFWLLYPDYPCEELYSEEVLGDMKLRRCAAPELN